VRRPDAALQFLSESVVAPGFAPVCGASFAGSALHGSLDAGLNRRLQHSANLSGKAVRAAAQESQETQIPTYFDGVEAVVKSAP